MNPRWQLKRQSLLRLLCNEKVLFAFVAMWVIICLVYLGSLYLKPSPTKSSLTKEIGGNNEVYQDLFNTEAVDPNIILYKKAEEKKEELHHDVDSLENLKHLVIEGVTQTNDKKPTQKSEVDEKQEELNQMRRIAVKDAFMHAWTGYEKYAWGADELKPVSNEGADDWGGLGMTILDSIDTVLIMNLMGPYHRAKEFIADLNFKKNYDASTFETTIRCLGGLLSAYELSEDAIFLHKAKELADRILPAFDTPSGIPYSTVNLKSGRAYSPDWNGGASFLSEFGTLSLEFRKLAYHTGEKHYAEKVNHINHVLSKQDVDRWEGLYPVSYHPDREILIHGLITFGARGDSFYEYLLKQYLQTYKTENTLWNMYIRAMEGMKKILVKRTPDSNLTYIAEMQGNNIVGKMDHLVCFVPGMLALDEIPEHLELAKELMYTCWQFYERNPTGLAPEIAGFHSGDFKNQAAHYLLRPETVESLFILYRVTGDTKYQDWGWNIFNALETHCKTSSGYSGLRNVGVTQPEKDNRMESFFMAETLKYLYLLFSPKDLLPLDEYVFNTEAHPTKKFHPNW